MNKYEQELREKLEEYAQKIQVPENLLPSFDSVLEGSYIETNSLGVFSYIYAERGQQNLLKITANLDELLFEVFRHITFEIAAHSNVSYGRLGNIQVPIDIDSRRVYFMIQQVLMKNVNPDWESKIIDHHQDILKLYPFDDFLKKRIKLADALIKGGKSRHDAETLANQTYRLPKPR